MSVPIDKALEVIKVTLEEDNTLSERTPLEPDDIIQLLGLCLKCMYFLFHGEYYQHIHRAAMGSSVSLIMGNLYLESFEQKALTTQHHIDLGVGASMWDDTHTILKKIHSQEFTDHLNSVDEDIKWMTKGEVMTEVLLKGSATVGD